MRVARAARTRRSRGGSDAAPRRRRPQLSLFFSRSARSYYRIQTGDTFSSVALKFNTTVEQLQALNPGVDPHVLTVGQRIRVR